MNEIKLFKLFQKVNFEFYPVESGCAALFSPSPFGTDKPLLFRIAEILGEAQPKTKKDLLAISEIYLEFGTNFFEFLQKIDIKPGAYKVADISLAAKQIYKGKLNPKKIEIAELKLIEALNNNFKDYTTTIEVTETHIAMVKHSIWNFEYQYQIYRHSNTQISEDLVLIHNEAIKENKMFDYPIVCGDGKRPYGDLTYYYRELEALKVPGIKADLKKGDKYGPLFSSKEQKRIDKIQSELYLVLMAMASYGKLITN